MKILITGAAGFIASHVADAYIAKGHEVVIVDNLSTGNLRNLNPHAKFYHMDICDSAISEVFALEKPDLVNHHAAQISVPLSIANPLNDAEINVKGLINILQNCVAYKVQKVIYISSGGAMYGEATEYPTSETYDPKPLSVYAINKMVGEDYLYFYHHQYGLNYTVLRYANVYGPRQMSHGEAGVVSLFIEKLLSGSTPSIYRYPNEDQGMLRDYVFVRDVVRANLIALTTGSGEAFNVGTGSETSTVALYNEIEAQMQTGIVPMFGEARQGDLHRSLLNSAKARRELGWEAKYSLSEGISQVIAYFRELP
ncbi:MAG: NAD-dependent epimerase/dehydratase family protein [Candidatus Cloacimonas sp.]|jgi:UDP-glucose 4-epimerase|nr:NAD-dependent epimerase/dehydratase family protein [Candidatus Cloacimonas sp.]